MRPCANASEANKIFSLSNDYYDKATESLKVNYYLVANCFNKQLYACLILISLQVPGLALFRNLMPT